MKQPHSSIIPPSSLTGVFFTAVAFTSSLTEALNMQALRNRQVKTLTLFMVQWIFHAYWVHLGRDLDGMNKVCEILSWVHHFQEHMLRTRWLQLLVLSLSLSVLVSRPLFEGQSLTSRLDHVSYSASCQEDFYFKTSQDLACRDFDNFCNLRWFLWDKRKADAHTVNCTVFGGW